MRLASKIIPTNLVDLTISSLFPSISILIFWDGIFFYGPKSMKWVFAMFKENIICKDQSFIHKSVCLSQAVLI